MDEFVKTALQSNFYIEKLRTIDLEDWKHIPYTTKKELRETEPYSLIGVPFKKIATYHETSGTSGKPTPSWYSHKDTEMEASVITKSRLKLQPNDILLNRFPFALAIPSFILYWACQKTKATHIAASKATMVTPHLRVIELLLRTNATILAVLPSEAEILAEVAKQNGISLPTTGLRALFVAGEVLSPNRKKYLERLWGVPVIGFFGSTETGGLFVHCPEGHYHLEHPKALVECLDDNGDPQNTGQTGNCVISTAREGMPLLRYANEDLIQIEDGAACLCGKTESFLTHLGRKDDQVSIQGKNFTMYDLQEAVYSLLVVPFLWKMHVYDDHLLFEYQINDTFVEEYMNSTFEKFLSSKLGVPVKAACNELMDKQSLTTKPAYAKYQYLEKHLKEAILV
ncbi:phenylacetate--CoA ligase family protein [Falsibacillus albus]|uniref:Phenylacetate--CoA ligase family protein n=1 Tax=Falsibacillus albus TaxID=2478915 RepID=A0A3L7K1G7_9BACI|nr:AMP-binding protein [Falsibacillus albus]RLQ96229.1 phenylacetate--CoA ligase family protein [Falsibacillus albus]